MRKELLRLQSVFKVQDFTAGRELLYQELGGFFSEENIASKSQKGVMIEARIAGETVGATFAYQDKGRAHSFFSKTDLQLDPGLALYAAGIAVKKEWRGQGIGQALLEAREEAGASLGLKYIIGDSWLESPSPSAPLLEKQGMKEVARIQEYWRRDYPITDYCPQCGDICY